MPSFSSLIEMFRHRAEAQPSAPALWFKANGAYRFVTWTEFHEKVRQIALSLHLLDIRKGDRVGILSENRPEWAYADLGILSLGAVTVPIYPTTSERECQYILEHSEVSVLFASSADQLRKTQPFLGNKGFKQIICFDLKKSRPPDILTLAQCLEMGRRAHFNDCNLYDQLARQVAREDLATIIYTSGTTGPPKGVMLTHGNFLANCEAASEALPLGEGEKSLSFLPLSHVFERMAGYYFMIQQGASIAYAENMQTVPEDLLLVRPTIAASVPRLYEKMYARILETVEVSPPARRAIFFWALKVGRKTSEHRQRRMPLPFWLGIQFGLARLLVFNKLKRRLGGRIRFFISGSAPLAKELAEFFFAAEVLILEGYGLTETSPVISVNRPDRFKFGTVGPTLPGVEVRIAPDGEILTRGPHVMKGYFKNEEATREAIRDGWFHTGDIGEMDSEGFLKITDRKKDLIITAGGKNISPQNVENEILGDPLFTQVVTVGDRRPYVVALIAPNRTQLERLAEGEGIRAGSWEELLKNSRVQQLVDQRLRERMKVLAPYEQVKYFHLLTKELSQEAGELTPTLKVKRRVIAERYASIIDGLYQRGK